MLDPVLRPVKDRILLPLARPAAAVVHPTAVTLLGFGAGLACVVSLYIGEYAAGLALWAVNRLLDGLDGLIARTSLSQSDLGGYLDVLLDFVVYAAVPVALVHARPAEAAADAGLALALLLATFYVNAASWMYLSAVLEKRRRGGTGGTPRETSIEMPTGIVEGTETIVFFTAFILFPEHLVPMFLLMAVLVIATIGQRLLWAARMLPGSAFAGGSRTDRRRW